MNLNSELQLMISEGEARGLWEFLNTREDELSLPLASLLKRLEGELWDRMTIETFAAGGESRVE